MHEKTILDAIKQSGFVVEYEVSELLKKRGWHAATNRYYIDDVENKPREVDIIAYKKTRIDGVTYFTYLLISCKKSEENPWVFLERDHLVDASQILPINYISTDKVLNYVIEKDLSIDAFLAASGAPTEIRELLCPERYVFAASEVDTKNSRFKKDREGVYESISCLLKAQDYEKKKFSEADLEKSFATFFQVSVFDGEMLRVSFPASPLLPSSLNSIVYYNHHIIAGREQWVSVQFVRKDKFDDLLKTFETFSSLSSGFFNSRREKYFIGVFYDRRKSDAIWEYFKSFVLIEMQHKPEIKKHLWSGYSYLDYRFDIQSNCLTILVDLYPSNFKSLASSSDLRTLISDALIEFYKYENDLKIENIRE